MRRILLIEDERNIRTIISLLLRILGYEVEVAEDGEKGLEIFTRAGHFDLVITDIRMPKKNGNDVAKHIRSSERAETFIIAITAYKSEVQTGLFDSLLVKPFRNEELVETIRSLECPCSGVTLQVPQEIQPNVMDSPSIQGKN